MDTEKTADGGERGGHDSLLLSRSDLVALRRHASRYPLSDKARKDIMNEMVRIVRKSRSERAKVSAAKTIASLDKINLEEINLALEMEKTRRGESGQSGPVVINIVETVVVKGAETPVVSVIESGNGNGHVSGNGHVNGDGHKES